MASGSIIRFVCVSTAVLTIPFRLASGVCKLTAMAEPSSTSASAPEPVDSDELNAWKRGFTPQAEIWNGRLAMIGLSAGLAVVLLVRVFSGG